MKAKTFVTIFPLSSNVHLLKDVGMVPYIMHRDYGYDSTLVCFKNETAYPAIEKEVKGLKIHFLKKEKNYAFGKISFTVLRYLIKHARQIDVLNLYHNTTETLLYGLLYRLCNPKGLLYLKLDINIVQFDSQKKEKIHRLRMWGYSLFFRYIAGIVSCELPESFDYVLNAFPVLKHKIVLVTNGIDDVSIECLQPRILPENKENIVLTVGRIGASEKNNEMLLNALQQIELSNWKIVFAGPVEQSFEAVIEDFFQRNPQLREKVIFTGNITDRNELYSWYNRSKVFCLTSRFESFGIVLVEALYFGNYIISTPIASIDYITDNGRLGQIVQGEEKLLQVLRHIVSGALDPTLYYDSIVDYSTRFRWRDNLLVLDWKIKELIY